MNRAEVPREPTGDPRERFVRRPPSQGWEAIAAADRPPNTAWVWFKPAAVPAGLILRIAPEAFQTAAPAAQWTLRQLLLAADVDPAAAIMWRVNGVAFPAVGGTNPLLDLPVPAPVPGTDPNIVVAMALPAVPMMPVPMPPNGNRVAGANLVTATNPVAAAVNGNAQKGTAAAPMLPPGGFGAGHMMPVMPVPVGQPMLPIPVGAPPLPNVLGHTGGRKQEPVIPAPAHLMEAYEHVEQDWRSCQDTEKDLARLRQQLLDMMGRLKALNRELTGPERVHSTNQEKKDWQHARRMLRDCSNRLWKCVKAHDIGYTSSAGQRRWFEATYEKYIAPRRHFDGFADADRAFGAYRKIVTTLHIEMTNSLSIAQLDGERRAQQVLAKIAEKVREAGNRKNFLGVMLDS
jgi:hypothetical protein